VKGIYVSWSNDSPNAKIKDWNVTELKVCAHPSSIISSNFFLWTWFFSHRSTLTYDTLINPSLRISGRCCKDVAFLDTDEQAFVGQVGWRKQRYVHMYAICDMRFVVCLGILVLLRFFAFGGRLSLSLRPPSSLCKMIDIPQILDQFRRQTHYAYSTSSSFKASFSALTLATGGLNFNVSSTSHSVKVFQQYISYSFIDQDEY